MNKPLCQDYDSHSSEIQSDMKNGIKEYAEKCSGSAREELGEKRSEHDGMAKVIKSEPVEVEIDAEESRVSENGRVSQARSSGLHLRYDMNTYSVVRKTENCLAHGTFWLHKMLFSRSVAS